MVIRPREDHLVNFRSLNMENALTIDMRKKIEFDPKGGWGNYPMGVLHYLIASDLPLTGADVLYSSDLPIGAGLSSSASLEVLTAFAFMKMSNLKVDFKSLALLCQLVENDFIGVNCGIMDQYACALGKEGQAMFLDCSNLDCEYLPFAFGQFELLIMNSNVDRELAGSEYNKRKEQCEMALTTIQKKKPINNLCEAAFTDLELIKDEEIKSRARHVIWENQYVYEAKESLEDGDVVAFGESMDASHLSLANDYEVSCYELDFLVDTVRSFDGCVGARMTGAGFGGCAIALVEKDKISEVIEVLGERYKQATGIEATFFVAEVVDGVREL